MTPEQTATVLRVLKRANSTVRELFDYELDDDGIVLHVFDDTHPTGLRSWRWTDAEDVTEEYLGRS